MVIIHIPLRHLLEHKFSGEIPSTYPSFPPYPSLLNCSLIFFYHGPILSNSPITLIWDFSFPFIINLLTSA